jgi:5-methylcytosine-specific restriction endonuclease McrA
MRFYDSGTWKDIRRRQLARVPLCQGCPGTVPAVEVDHVVPLSQGGSKRDPANLQSLCRACHATKTSEEKYGRQWLAPKFRGCNPDGSPLMIDRSQPDHQTQGRINR